MKLTVTQENLSQALNTVSKVASSRSSLPILSNVLIKTVENRLLIASTDLDIAVSHVIGAKVSKEGSITVPARLMQDYVSSLPSSTLNLSLEGNTLHIKTDHHSSTINGTPADDFPVMPTIEKAQKLSLSSKVFKDTLTQVLFAASSDESRPILNGLYLHASEGELYAAATDSYRLAEKRVGVQAEDLSIVIPARSLQEVLRVLKDSEEPMSLEYDDQQAQINIGSVTVVTRLIDGVYPDYRKLLPTEFESTAKVAKKDLQEITKVSSLFAREAAGGITLSLEAQGEISIRSIASHVGENTAVAKADVTEDSVITLNSRYILDALNVVEGDNIEVNIKGKLDPLLIRDLDNDDYLHIVMPVKS